MAVDSAARNDRAFCMLVRLACRCELFRFLVNKRASPPCVSPLPSNPSLSLSPFISPLFLSFSCTNTNFPWSPKSRVIPFPLPCPRWKTMPSLCFRVGPQLPRVVDRENRNSSLSIDDLSKIKLDHYMYYTYSIPLRSASVEIEARNNNKTKKLNETVSNRGEREREREISIPLSLETLIGVSRGEGKGIISRRFDCRSFRALHYLRLDLL